MSGTPNNMLCLFFFSSRRRHTRSYGDWSSDVCSSDLVAGQILRSGTSPYPNHGEAEDAESREDFIHKLKVCLKELRETRRWARLTSRKNWAKDDSTLLFVLNESDELIRIFFDSIQTA